MKRMIATALLLMSINALASDWQVVGKHSRYTLLIDVQSVTWTKALPTAWFRYDFPTPQVNPVSQGKPYTIMKIRVAVNCPKRSLARLQAVFLTKDQTVGSSAVDMTAAVFTEVSPDSIGEHMLELVCIGPN